MTKKAILIPLASLLWLIGVGCATPSPAEQTSSTETSVNETADQAAEVADQKTVTILYTDEGYIPASITIASGTSVTFVNANKQDMWPASTIHPTHREYPTTGGCLGSTFDACARIKPGQSWSFTFDITGTWKFHDHLSPTFFGSITVE